MKEPCDQDVEDITSKDKVKDLNERTVWSGYRGIHKQRQRERSQWENHVIRMYMNSQAKAEWKSTMRKPCDQCITKLQIGTRWSGYHKITDWNHMIRVSQNYRLEPCDQGIANLQVGTMWSGYQKITDWNHVISYQKITD